jgi:Flp pilus assembly protein TadG
MSRTSRPGSRASDGPRGQALVEFALTVIIFIFIVMGVLDLGRGIFMYNGVSEAAREIARVTSVHPGAGLGTGSWTPSTEAQEVIDSQSSIVWNLSVDEPTCVDIDGSAVATCLPGTWVKVTVSAEYTPATPMLIPIIGTKTVSSTSSVQIP